MHARGRDGGLSEGEEGFFKEASISFPEAGQKEEGPSFLAESSCTSESGCTDTRRSHSCREASGRVEELLVAEELWNNHKKPFFFPFSSAATCTNHPLEVDQRTSSTQKVTMKCKRKSKSRMGMRPIEEQAPCVKRRKVWSAIEEPVLALAGSGADPVNAMARCVTFHGLVATARHVAT
ncbi:hypothetical protein Taro_042303 [Colocasia esculenta]|uniref:Uncharacterized protein n=1 Tax=Colocasia esculenta TaxID=4460 RepID=A0A843WW40_COLES|nr:hypothetical protein [Colocasia esculenta]